MYDFNANDNSRKMTTICDEMDDNNTIEDDDDEHERKNNVDDDNNDHNDDFYHQPRTQAGFEIVTTIAPNLAN